MVNIPPSYWIFLTLFTACLGLVILAGIAFVVLDPLAESDDGTAPTATTVTQAVFRNGPTIDFSRLPRNEVQVGVPVPIIVSATDDEFGIESIELEVEEAFISPDLLEGQRTAQINFVWVPGRTGNLPIVVRAESDDENTLTSEEVYLINVVERDASVDISQITTFSLTLQLDDDPFALALDYGVCPDELANANPALSLIDPGEDILIPTNTGRSTTTYGQCERNGLITVEMVNFFVNQRIGVHRNLSLLNAPYPINPRYTITAGRAFECSGFFTGVDGVNSTYNCPPEKPWMHTGIDIGAETGTELYAVAEGTVSWAGSFLDWQIQVNNRPNYTDDCYLINGSEPPHEGYGNMVLIERGNTAYVYAHLSAIRVQLGDNVQVGDVIGFVGSTGCSTAPHLHFEVRRNAVTIDPVEYLEGLSE